MNHVDFGPLVMTAAIAADPTALELIPSLTQRFYCCDWGDICAEDAAVNDDVVAGRSDAQILASYGRPEGEAIWIICNGFGQGPDPDYCHTTILFPSDY